MAESPSGEVSVNVIVWKQMKIYSVVPLPLHCSLLENIKVRQDYQGLPIITHKCLRFWAKSFA